jgi:hypothetical protein
MSERYGTINEAYELLPEFEDWVRKTIEDDEAEIRHSGALGGYLAGRMSALRDVLDWWGVSGK